MTLITTLIYLDLTKQRSLLPRNQHFIQKFQAMTFIVPDHPFEHRRGWIFSYINSYSSRNMFRRRASASSRVPNTKKQMKVRGRKPSAFTCLFDVFGTRDEARSPSFRHVFSNETIENYAVTCFPPGGEGTWVFFGLVCAAKLAPRSKKIPLKLIPRSRNGPIFYTPF